MHPESQAGTCKKNIHNTPKEITSEYLYCSAVYTLNSLDQSWADAPAKNTQRPYSVTVCVQSFVLGQSPADTRALRTCRNFVQDPRQVPTKEPPTSLLLYAFNRNDGGRFRNSQQWVLVIESVQDPRQVPPKQHPKSKITHTDFTSEYVFSLGTSTRLIGLWVFGSSF